MWPWRTKEQGYTISENDAPARLLEMIISYAILECVNEIVLQRTNDELRILCRTPDGVHEMVPAPRRLWHSLSAWIHTMIIADDTEDGIDRIRYEKPSRELPAKKRRKLVRQRWFPLTIAVHFEHNEVRLALEVPPEAHRDRADVTKA